MQVNHGVLTFTRTDIMDDDEDVDATTPAAEPAPRSDSPPDPAPEEQSTIPTAAREESSSPTAAA